MRIKAYPAESGVTIIELLVVLSLVGLIYTLVAPNFRFQQVAEETRVLGQLSSDVRAVFDLAILNSRDYRLAFHLGKNKYEVEISDGPLAVSVPAQDVPSQRLEEEEQEFEETWKRYEELAGASIRNEAGEELSRFSPVLAAKNVLKPRRWVSVSDFEGRSLGPLVVKALRAQHHGKEDRSFGSPDDLSSVAYVYIHPGYLEPFVLHLTLPPEEAPSVEGGGEQAPPGQYTVSGRSYQGEMVVQPGLVEKDVSAAQGGGEDNETP